MTALLPFLSSLTRKQSPWAKSLVNYLIVGCKKEDWTYFGQNDSHNGRSQGESRLSPNSLKTILGGGGANSFLLIVKGELFASFDWVGRHPGVPRSPPKYQNWSPPNWIQARRSTLALIWLGRARVLNSLQKDGCHFLGLLSHWHLPFHFFWFQAQKVSIILPPLLPNWKEGQGPLCFCLCPQIVLHPSRQNPSP